MTCGMSSQSADALSCRFVRSARRCPPGLDEIVKRADESAGGDFQPQPTPALFGGRLVTPLVAVPDVMLVLALFGGDVD
jgi:hypothetical protein